MAFKISDLCDNTKGDRLALKMKQNLKFRRAKYAQRSAGLPTKRRPLHFLFTPRPNTARNFSSRRSDKGYQVEG